MDEAVAAMTKAGKVVGWGAGGHGVERRWPKRSVIESRRAEKADRASEEAARIVPSCMFLHVESRHTLTRNAQGGA